MKMPRFTAEESLYKTSEFYLTMPTGAVSITQVVPQRTFPSGLCKKASRYCQVGTEQPWCNILEICGLDGDPSPVPPLCVPTTTCSQDRATTDPSCQICYRDNCNGTTSVWHTC